MGDAEVHALQAVDLDIAEGDFLAVVGPSGSGKSTLLNILGCLDRPSAGEFRFRGQEVGSLPDAERTRLRQRQIAVSAAADQRDRLSGLAANRALVGAARQSEARSTGQNRGQLSDWLLFGRSGHKRTLSRRYRAAAIRPLWQWCKSFGR